MILVDANVPMYAAGANHPNKARAIQFLRRVAEGEVEAVVDAEVLQEIVHRYTALGRWDEGRIVYSTLRQLFPEVLAVTGAVLDQAMSLVDRSHALTARDAVHAAVVIVYRLDGICTFDRDFDRIPGCARIEP